MFDVIIIGGGLAGTACAKLAVDRGMSALLLEKASGVGTKVCSEGVPLSVDGVMDLSPFVINRMKGADVFLDHELIHSSTGRKLVGYIVDRHRLCAWLASEVVRHGSTVLTETRARAVIDRTVHTDRGDTYRGRYIVFADGTRTLARAAFDFRQYRTFTALQYLVKGCRIERPDFVSLHLFSDDVAFGWIFPLSASVAHVGVSSEKPSVVKRLLDQLMQLRAVRRGAIVSLRGARMPCGGMLPRVVDARKRYLVCGDAAGQYLPLIGEGNRLALAAADCATRAMARNRLSLYPKSFTRFTSMLAHHGRFFDLLNGAVPELRKQIIRQFSPMILSANFE